MFLNLNPISHETPKSQKDPKIKSNSKARIEGIVENESCSTT